MRIGLHEMRRFAKQFYAGVKEETFLESCGVADLITTCYGGRNVKVASEFVRTKKVLFGVLVLVVFVFCLFCLFSFVFVCFIDHCYPIR